jgi:hypothetical protein
MKMKQTIKSFAFRRLLQIEKEFYVVYADEGPEAWLVPTSICLTVHQSESLTKIYMSFSY